MCSTALPSGYLSKCNAEYALRYLDLSMIKDVIIYKVALGMAVLRLSIRPGEQLGRLGHLLDNA